MKKTMLVLLLAALPPAGTWADSTPPPASSAGGQVMQRPPLTQPGSLEDDPAFKRLAPEQQEWVRTTLNKVDTAIERKDIDALEQIRLDIAKGEILGMTLCGHAADEGTFVDADVQNASREEAFAIRWLGPRGTVVHSAVFTGRTRCVVTDGDTVDGRLVVRALPNSLAVSNQHAMTAWEAEYWNSPAEQGAGGTPHRGVFIENRFLTELDPQKASAVDSRDLTDESRDFRWNDEQETLAVKPEVVLAGQARPVSAVKTNCPPQHGAKVKAQVPQKPSVWACKHLGICADDRPAQGSGGGCPAAPADGQTAK